MVDATVSAYSERYMEFTKFNRFINTSQLFLGNEICKYPRPSYKPNTSFADLIPWINASIDTKAEEVGSD